MLPPFPLSYMPATFEFLAVLIVLTLSLLMIFAGSRLIQWISFVVVGLMVAYVGTTLGGEYLGPVGGVLGFVGGFLLGGASTLLFLPVGMGLAVGLSAFGAAQTLVTIPFVPVLVGIVGFAYGFLLTDLLIAAISAAVGGLLLFSTGVTVGFAPAEMLLISAAATAAGTAMQSYLARRASNLFGQAGTSYRARRAQRRRQ